MTDLERLWEDYSPAPVPTRAILDQTVAKPLASGSAGQRHSRRLLTRPLWTAAAVTGLACAFVAGTLIAGDSSSGPGSPPGIEALPSRVAFTADLEPAESCDDLLASYVDRALALVRPWGWGGGPDEWYDARLDGLFDQESGDLLAGRGNLNELGARKSGYQGDLGKAVANSAAVERQVNSDTGTNVQEAAVDEPDTVKTDGEILATVRDDLVTVYDVTGASTKKLSTLDLPGLEDAEIMLDGDTMVAVGADDRSPQASGSRVLTISLADPSKPEITEQVAYDAALISARQHGPTVRLVLASGLPELDFVAPRGKRSPQEALQHNREQVEATTLADWLPTATVGDADPEQLLDCDQVAVPTDELALDTTSVVGFDIGSPGTVDAIGLAGRTDISYESADYLYLATSGGVAGCLGWCKEPGMGARVVAGAPTGSSYLFAFELDGVEATHVASGEVEGSIRDRWSMDEADGVLRVAVGPTQETGNFNSIVTLARDGTDLLEHGRLDELGRGEEIKSVRWFDDLAMVVTFRQVDPLYSIDLTDTAQPTLISELKIPGFSSYLHPLGGARMIGVGEGPQGNGAWGAQIGLFDVRDTRNVTRLDVLGYGRGTEALAGLDPRAFTWLPEHRTVLTVVQRHAGRRVGYVSVLKLKGGQFLERRVKVEYGADVDQVRAVPMPDGRVVLVTGEDAQYFEL